MEQRVIETFQEHRRRYGSRRIAFSLNSQGEAVSRYKADSVISI